MVLVGRRAVELQQQEHGVGQRRLRNDQMIFRCSISPGRVWPLALVCALILGMPLTGCNSKPPPPPAPKIDDRVLVDAAKGGDVKKLMDLLAAGGSVEARNESGRTLVALAALRGNTAVVKKAESI